jgi:hypothetical protein
MKGISMWVCGSIPARYDVGAAGIDPLGARRGCEILADRLDEAVLAKDVGAKAAIGGDHGPAADQHGHGSSHCVVPA